VLLSIEKSRKPDSHARVIVFDQIVISSLLAESEVGSTIGEHEIFLLGVTRDFQLAHLGSSRTVVVMQTIETNDDPHHELPIDVNMAWSEAIKDLRRASHEALLAGFARRLNYMSGRNVLPTVWLQKLDRKRRLEHELDPKEGSIVLLTDGHGVFVELSLEEILVATRLLEQTKHTTFFWCGSRCRHAKDDWILDMFRHVHERLEQLARTFGQVGDLVLENVDRLDGFVKDGRLECPYTILEVEKVVAMMVLQVAIMFARVILTPDEPNGCSFGSERLSQELAKDFSIDDSQVGLCFQLSVYLHLGQDFITCFYNFDNSFYVLGSIKLVVTKVDLIARS
jgi:hypothetical protein